MTCLFISSYPFMKFLVSPCDYVDVGSFTFSLYLSLNQEL